MRVHSTPDSASVNVISRAAVRVDAQAGAVLARAEAQDDLARAGAAAYATGRPRQVAWRPAARSASAASATAPRKAAAAGPPAA